MPSPTSYTPTTWVDASTSVDATNMNHVEGGISQIVTDYGTHQAAATLDHPDASVTDAKIGNRTPDETVTATTGAHTLSFILSSIANRIKAITGASHWYSNPATTIAALNTGKLNNDSGAITTDGSGNLTVAGISTGAGLSVPFLNYHAASSGIPLRIYENGSSANGFEIGRLGTDGNGTNNSCIAVLGTGGVGFKTGGIAGTKIMEISPGGILTVTGGNPCFVTTNASVGFASGHSFDAFDVGEIYETDQEYEGGTVLCPQGSIMRRCTHKGCHAALIVSKHPGLALGSTEAIFEETGKWGELLALAGRVKVTASGDVPERALVCSDGLGGVRAMLPGESGYSVGVALHGAVDGKVGVLVQRGYCVAPPAEGIDAQPTGVTAEQ